MGDAGETGREGGDGGSPRGRRRESPWEWAAAGVSALLVLGAVGFMTHEALNKPTAPPRISIEVDSIVAGGEGYLVEFRARNSGQRTAAQLLVEGELRSDTGSVEKSEATIDYVPAEGLRRGGLHFSHDPRLYRLEIRPKGYDYP